MSIRLLLTLLVLGLGGTECQSNAAPAWTKQSHAIDAQTVAAEHVLAEINEPQFDSDLDVVPATQQNAVSSRSIAVFLLDSTELTAQRFVPQARAPPQIA